MISRHYELRRKGGTGMKFDISKAKSGDHDYDVRKKDILDKGQLRVNDLIAPDAIENEMNHIQIGKRYLRTIIITGYPRTVHIGWLNRLYSYAANIDISSHIEPMPTNKVIKSLNRKISQYISTQRMDAERGKISDVAIDTALDDAEELRDKLQKGMERLYYQAIYISIAGKNEEELDMVTDEIETLCGQMGMTTRHAMWQQPQAFNSVLPISDDRLRHRRNFDTSSLATCFPIVSAELTDTRGTPLLYGINLINQSLVMFDRFKLNNYNSITLATAGSGKSYFVKLEAIRSMALGTNIIIIDPQGEYKDIAEAVGGQYIKLSANSKDRINPLDLQFTGREDEGMDFLTQKILDVYSIIEVMLKRELDARERKVVLNALEDTYRKFGFTRETKSVLTENYVEGDYFQLQGTKKSMPTLSDLDKSLRKYEEGIQISDQLDPYIGGFLGLFNGETNINPDSRFIVFDIKDMERELGELAMFIVLEFVWGKIKAGDMKRRLLVVDEAWMLMNNPQSAEYVVRVAKTARKFNAGLSIISQQARDFLTNNGEGIVGNTSMQVLLRQHPNDIKHVAEMFNLSGSEVSLIKTAEKGEALIFAGGNHTAVQVVSHDFEHILCSTDPDDVVQLQELKKIFLEENE
jgi:conjugal transfer ATP-binding protein TraC